MLTPSDVRRLLAEYGLAPNKHYGQNFVVDANTVRKIVRAAGVDGGQVVCEVGAGLGSLTHGLREAGANVVAVEVDAGMVSALEAQFGEDGQVTVVHGDALTADYRSLMEGSGAAKPRLVANLPYNTATPIVINALKSGCFDQLVVMVQKEVGQRWAATVGAPLFGAVSLKLSAYAQVGIIGPVSRQAFYPVPNVDSITVRLTPEPWRYPADRARVLALVSAGFQQRRKRLRNLLAPLGHRPADVEQALQHIGAAPGARGEELDLDAWAALAEQLGA